MSRIGKQFITIPEKVQVKLDGQKIVVNGPKGSLSRILPSLVCCTLDEENKKLFFRLDMICIMFLTSPFTNDSDS